MRTTFILSLAVLGSACGSMEPTAQKHDSTLVTGGAIPQTAEGQITNALPYDGCSYPVTIADVRYAPSTSSSPKITALAPPVGKTPVRLDYQLTGGDAQVECGWGSRQTLPEIVIVSISISCPVGQSYATTCTQCGPAGGCAAEKTACTPTCDDSNPCAAGTCHDGVCWLAYGCI